MAVVQPKGEACEVAFAAATPARASSPVGGTLKRLFDVAFSLVAIASALPFFLLLPLVIYFVAPGPVFFRHTRIGFGGKSFPCLKFRTMVADADRVLDDHLARDPEARAEFARHRKLKNDPRVIPIVGAFLRKSSLDELPQFLNVLRGDMSVVGPRPLTLEELRDYGKHAGHYKAARPGITGLWQVSGRSDLSFGKRVELDSRYVATCSFPTDMHLILRTVRVLINGHGAY
ncbi:MAG: sugar transferase [Defluviimonas sp.]|uniref:sugar transferase n=1 Tax=Albidovulum sp. TaxID=1872424 RepID=UPI002A295CE5|nr:sugar transferase [Defluviimonas sp.]